jgi:glycosyltransferase involved in cell wall biosynthesis
MRLLLIIRSLDVGGAERQCRDLSLALRARGHEVVLCTLGAGGPLTDTLSAGGVLHLGLGHAGPRNLLRTLVRLRRVYREFRPDVIYSWLPVSNLLAAWSLPRRLRTRLVWAVRASSMDLPDYGRLARLVPAIERRFARRPALIIVNSEAGVAHHASIGFPRERMVCVENAIDIMRFRFSAEARQILRSRHSITDDRKVVVLVARVDPVKGHAFFIDAAARVAAERDDVDFWCIGDGDAGLRSRLQALAEARGICHRLRWLAQDADIAAYFSAADLAVSASLFEGFSNTVAEALCCGVPVVGTEAGDTARIIGSCGAAVPPGDAPAMSRAILAQLNRVPPDREVVRQSFLGRFDPGDLLARHEAALISVAA